MSVEGVRRGQWVRVGAAILGAAAIMLGPGCDSDDGGTTGQDTTTADTGVADTGVADTGPADDATATAFTQAELQTLIQTRCTPCHITTTSQGLNMDGDFTANTVDVPSVESSLDRIEPGDRQASYLFHKISGTQASVGGSGGRMPLSGPPFLTDEEIERIGLFIDGL